MAEPIVLLTVSPDESAAIVAALAMAARVMAHPTGLTVGDVLLSADLAKLSARVRVEVEGQLTP